MGVCASRGYRKRVSSGRVRNISGDRRGTVSAGVGEAGCL